MTARRKDHGAPILSARGIVNRFGKQVVHDKLDLDIMSGEIIGIAGGSGPGNEVLLRNLTGLHRPAAGKGMPKGNTHDAPRRRDTTHNERANHRVRTPSD